MAWTRAVERMVGRRGEASENGAKASVRVVDAVADGRDWLPGTLDTVQQIVRVIRHPRSVLRSAKRGV